jgi:hypothetical protein
MKRWYARASTFPLYSLGGIAFVLWVGCFFFSLLGRRGRVFRLHFPEEELSELGLDGSDVPDPDGLQFESDEVESLEDSELVDDSLGEVSPSLWAFRALAKTAPK